MENSKYFTKALIPTNGVWITENYSPKGFFVGRYDAEGMVEAPRYKATMDEAVKYAETL